MLADRNKNKFFDSLMFLMDFVFVVLNDSSFSSFAVLNHCQCLLNLIFSFKGFLGKKKMDLRNTNTGQIMKERILSTGCDISRFKNFWGPSTAGSNSFTIRRKKRRYKTAVSLCLLSSCCRLYSLKLNSKFDDP